MMATFCDDVWDSFFFWLSMRHVMVRYFRSKINFLLNRLNSASGNLRVPVLKYIIDLFERKREYLI